MSERPARVLPRDGALGRGRRPSRRRRSRRRRAPPARRRRGRALLAPARPAGVERGGAARPARGERARGRRRRARLAGRGLPRRRGRRAARDRRLRRRRGLEPPPPDAALHARRRRRRRPRAPRRSCASSTPRSSSSPTRRASRRAMLEGADLVVDCSDSFATRYEVNARLLRRAACRWSRAASSASRGLVMAIRPGESACYRCAFPEPPPPGAAPSCAEAGVLGPAAGVIGSLQALEALKLLAGLDGALLDAFLQVDLHDHGFLRVRRRAPGGLPGLCHAVAHDRHPHRGPRGRELRRDVSAAHERDPAARGVSRSRSSPPGRACTRCSPTASRTRCTTPACRSPRARSPRPRAR